MLGSRYAALATIVLGPSVLPPPDAQRSRHIPATTLSPYAANGKFQANLVLLATALAFMLPPPAVTMATSTLDCDATSTYAANSTFQANLNLLAAALPVNASASPAGFATGAVGTAPYQANGLALCRGDTNASTCAACVAEAFRDAQQACPLDMGATAYLDACVLRFASSQFLDFLREDQWVISELVYDYYYSP